MANNSSNVSFGKPNVAGGFYYAPAGTAVPTDATTALDKAFVSVGYISDDGLVNSVSTDTQDVNAWGGDKVASTQTTFGETFTINLLETSTEALKLYYGDGNVTQDADGKITVKQNSAVLPQFVGVAEISLTGGRVKRIVIPRAQISDRSGDISYTDSDAIMYPIQINALPDNDGNTHIEYIASTAAASLKVTSVAVTGDNTVVAGADLKLTATATMSDKSTTTDGITWNSSATDIATVKDGTVHGVKAGSTNITATKDDVTSPVFKVTVTAPQTGA